MISADKPNPSLCLIASSSTPETLALARFNGLPIIASSDGFCIYEVLGRSEGVPESRDEAPGGVDPAVGDVETDDLRGAAESPPNGSAECWRFNYEFNQYMRRNFSKMVAKCTDLDFLNALRDLALSSYVLG